ncbi:MAG: TonB-dependent receptor [Sphingomicrobium sp.]
MNTQTLLLAGTALLLVPGLAHAQAATPPATSDQEQQQNAQQAQEQADADAAAQDEEDSQTIYVTGTKLRGSVIGDIPPENVLSSGDVRATGATNINDLLDAIAPEIGSTQGRGGERPVMLLNGQRISSFRELRDIPTEAISRVEILPEEVALKYGYSATQKVVNIVLRPRFRSTAAELEGKAATEGGYVDGTADVTRLMIAQNGRTSINLHAEGNNMLTENERDISVEQIPGGPDPADLLAARSLIGSKRDLRGSVTVNRQLGTVGATGNVELEHNDGRSLIGLGQTLLEPLARNTTTDTAHAGLALNGNISSWRWSVTGNADASHGVTRTDRDVTDIRDRATTTTVSGDIDATANGNLFRLPAGDASATFKVGADTLHLDADRTRNGVENSNSLSRTSGNAAVNVDLPVSRRNSDFGALGNLSLNANAAVQQLSDFGTLTTIGAGVNFSPAQRLNLIGSWTREEGAPTVDQLGDPVLETPETRIFDFTTGQTVLVNAITGGNPNLQSDRRNVLKLGVNWQPIETPSLRLRADYVHQAIQHPISNFPGPSAALEAAFPDRFVRCQTVDPDAGCDSIGQLLSVDLRPVNYDRSRLDTLRIGFDFSKSLKSAAPSQAAIAAFRARRGATEQGSAQQSGAPQGQQQSPSGAAPQVPGGGRGFGRFGGGRNGGRLTFSLTDTITLVDNVTIRDGLKLDYLHGDAQGQAGGQPRHSVEARAGYFNNGLGARLSANWTSGTEVTTAIGDNLHFSPLATFNLRLFANLGQRFDLVAKHPWLRGTSVQFEVDNIFDTKPNVRDAFGKVPIGFQPDLLDPLGRTVGITIRKLFLPPPSAFRRSAPGGGGDE